MCKKILIVFIGTLFLTAGYAQVRNYVQYVNPFIGTATTGHTFPGATLPFGMVQVSPETGFMGWEHCSGYHYDDDSIMGFSHTHLSGTGGKDLGDLLLLPFSEMKDQQNPKSSFSHAEESASPGYYTVKLKDFKVKAELTATAHAALHRYTYGSDSGKLLIDLRHGLVGNLQKQETHVLSSQLTIVDKTTIQGCTITQGWAGVKHVYFVIRLLQPIDSWYWLSDSALGRNQRMVVRFANDAAKRQYIRVGISGVSIANAVNNLEEEIPKIDFAAVKKKAENKWNNYLATIEIEGSGKQKQIFYTAMYHALIAPNNIADNNGQYRGADNEVYTAAGKSYYSTLSLWDTYRALQPLYTIICPDKTSEIISSMIAHFEVQQFLPIWTLWGHENFCMIANHAIPVIADAYLKGLRGYDIEKAYRAMIKSSTVMHKNSDWEKYNRYGYLPCDSVKSESVSTTLEMAYDDWCVAQMAKALGKQKDYTVFMRRAGFYKNLFDTAAGLMRGRQSNGEWRHPFDPFKISHASTSGGDFTEGNAWHYTWHVQQDVPGLINLMGGQQRFIQKLDSLFSFPPTIVGDGSTSDVSGLIGQYVQGNEPSHHVAYLYTLAGEPWKTQEKIHTIVTTLYNNTPDGLSGNDDCGQMSAWFIFSSVGFYPVNPADGHYVFGVPSFSKARIKTGAKEFTISAKDLSAKNRYVQQILLNGKNYHQLYLQHKDLMAGGNLLFVMGPRPANFLNE
jgi:predicted alpha-1,2-mannosidase